MMNDVLRHCEGARRVLSLFAKQTVIDCFSSPNKEQFDRALRKLGRLPPVEALRGE